jgi:hypothetical protein
MAIMCFLQLAGSETTAEDSALVFSDGALDLQQDLAVRIVQDRVLQEYNLDAGAAELLKSRTR